MQICDYYDVYQQLGKIFSGVEIIMFKKIENLSFGLKLSNSSLRIDLVFYILDNI